jgi:hypothetical protein
MVEEKSRAMISVDVKAESVGRRHSVRANSKTDDGSVATFFPVEPVVQSAIALQEYND